MKSRVIRPLVLTASLALMPGASSVPVGGSAPTRESVILWQQARNVEKVGFYVTPGSAWGVAIAGNYAYVADGGGGLVILRFVP